MAEGGNQVVSALAESATNIGLEAGQITINEVGRIFSSPDGNEVVALQEVNLEIQPGEFVSLVGPSGCGKSTLLRLIAGLDQPSFGMVAMDREPIGGPGYQRGLVFQDPNLFPWLNVRRNVASGLQARKVLREKRQEVGEFIKLIGLQGFENAYPHQLSGGMAQRVALARTLVNHPKVLLLDEPLGALDAFTRMFMQDEILKLWEQRRTTTVLVTHDIDEAIYLSDRIVMMTPRPGKIEKIIPVELGRPRNRKHPEFFRLRARILEDLHLVTESQLSYYI